MDDDELKKILIETKKINIDENAKKRAINLALAEFQVVKNEKNKKSLQGYSFISRLMGMSNASLGRKNMEHTSKRKFMYGGMATAMVVVLIASYSVSELNHSRQTLGAVETALITPAEPIYMADADKIDINEEIPMEADGRVITVPAPSQQLVIASNEQQSFSYDKPKEKRRDYVAGKSAAPQKLAEAKSEYSAANTPPPEAAIPAARTYEMGFAEQGLAKSKSDEIQSNNIGTLVENTASEMERSVVMPIAPSVVVAADTVQTAIQHNDQFSEFKPNVFQQVAIEPVSTFSSDVDTASYSFIRRQLNNGTWPEKDAVRVEEMINYFDYSYALPESTTEPFKPTVTVMDSPWAKGKKLMHIGIQGYDITENSKPETNLVFLLDVSGSMDEPNKLPLLKSSMKMLLESLKPNDTIAITVYAGAAGTVLEPTKVSDRNRIISAIDNLNAGGSTAGEAGIRLAYQLAEQNFKPEGINRVILATDGDFNVGTSSPDELKSLVEQKRESGIFLSVLGFGQGNYNDTIMQTLAQNGNGVAAYIDTLNEARKVLVDEANASLFPIAKDVKFQVEFNPATVAEYRLVGYETRALNREDFNNDKIDAGDIGAGHTVTAIYEFVPVGSDAVSVDKLRYGAKENCQFHKVHSNPSDKNSPLVEKEICSKSAPPALVNNNEYAYLKIRYKLPNENISKLIDTPISSSNREPDADVKFSVAVAAFGQILKNDTAIQNMNLDDVIALANANKGTDTYGYRAEFINLVRLVKSIKP